MLDDNDADDDKLDVPTPDASERFISGRSRVDSDSNSESGHSGISGERRGCERESRCGRGCGCENVQQRAWALKGMHTRRGKKKREDRLR